MDHPAWVWVLFNAVLLALLWMDLAVFHRRPHAVSFREAVAWSCFWIALALLFGLGLWGWEGRRPALEFLTAYLIEKSLSVDNLFVFALIFSYFQVAPRHQHRVLFWGILGALVMRAFFILSGIALLERFHWVAYLFGAFLVVTGIRLALERQKRVEPQRNPVVRLFKRFFPVEENFTGDAFFLYRAGRLTATPLFVVLLMVEATDLVFAVDSVPAVIAVTADPFLAYTSNAFAILGLRALYFVLADWMGRFHYLHYGLAAILTFVGVKMLLSDLYHLPIAWTLSVIGLILLGAIALSLRYPPKSSVGKSA